MTIASVLMPDASGTRQVSLRRWRAVHSPDSKSTACPGESLVTTCSGITHLPADAGEASHHKSRLRGKAYQRVSLNPYGRCYVLQPLRLLPLTLSHRYQPVVLQVLGLIAATPGNTDELAGAAQKLHVACAPLPSPTDAAQGTLRQRE